MVVQLSTNGVYIVFFVLFNTINALSNVAEMYDAHSFGFIRSSPYPHFVMFYAPWCSHCSKVMTIWDKLAEINHQRRRLKIVKVDCVDSTPICASEKIKGYPTFRLYEYHQSVTYRGKKRSVNDFNQFIQDHLPSLSDGQVPDDKDGISSHTSSSQQPIVHEGVIVLTEDTFQKEVGRRMTFVDFFAPWCSHCQKLEPVWNRLADRFSHESKVAIAKVDCTAELNLCRQKSINAYPTLLLFKDGGTTVVEYNNQRSLGALTEFVSDNLQNVWQSINLIPSGSVKWLDRIQIIDTLANGPLCVYMHSPWQDSSIKNLPEYEVFANRLAATTKLNFQAVIFDCTNDDGYCKKFEMSKTHSPIIVYFRGIDDYVIFDQSEAVTADGLMDFVVKSAIFVDETLKKKNDEL